MSLGLPNPIVLGLPRGGVPVAAEVAAALDAPLDVVVVRKLGHPDRPELAVGALAEDGEPWIHPAVGAELGVGPRDLQAVVQRERAEIDRQRRLYVGDRHRPDLAGRTAVVVDDGLATGSTARAAIGWVRQRGAHSVVVAVPVAPPDTVAELATPGLAGSADRVVAVAQPSPFAAVGRWYLNFEPVSDEEVRRLLGHGLPDS